MVGLLIDLRATIARHQLARGSAAAIVTAIAFGLLSAAGTLLLGIVHPPRLAGACDRVSAVLALWLGGQLAQAALNGGDASLRPELLAALPLPRRRLANALLLVGACDPALVIVALADAAVITVAISAGVAATLVSVLTVIELLALTSVAATVIGGSLGPGARRSRDRGTIVVAVAISLLALAGTLLPVLLSALADGRSVVLTAIVRILPSGWPGDAVIAVHRSQPLLLAAVLAAPLLCTAALVLAWPRVLARRMTGRSSAVRARHSGRLAAHLPATATMAVAVKELRLWLRDPVRITCLLIALIVGVGTGVVPTLTSHTPTLEAFAGPLSIVIAGACACNLYGSDGTSLWLTVVSPGAARSDVRGRQLGWLLAVAPITTAETVALTAAAGRANLWPWALGLLIALLGGAAGLIPLASLIAVQPLDEAGNPTPGFSIKVHVCLIVVALTALPTAALIALGTFGHHAPLAWLGVALAVVTAAASTAGLGVLATRRLAEHEVDVLRLLAIAA